MPLLGCEEVHAGAFTPRCERLKTRSNEAQGERCRQAGGESSRLERNIERCVLLWQIPSGGHTANCIAYLLAYQIEKIAI